MNRRRWIKRALGAAIVAPIAAGGYGVLESKWLRLNRVELPVPNLPPAFWGTTVVYISDTHHGPHVPLSYVRDVVSVANATRPDLVLLGGDYVSQNLKFVAPGVEALGGLRASLGRFAVLGNHDVWQGAPDTREALAGAGIVDVTNHGVWIEKKGARLRIAGVGDYWTEEQDIRSALGDATERDASILLSHNPDFAEEIDDRRVGLVLSGHTHGGQVSLPFWGAPWAPTRYGSKYLQGLAQAPSCRVFVSRGAGTSGPPVRFDCRPEVVHITLRPEPSPGRVA